jgi:hypothetical protein
LDSHSRACRWFYQSSTFFLFLQEHRCWDCPSFFP